MVKLTVCVAGVCYSKGSMTVGQQFKQLINNNGLANKIQLSGEFCMGRCHDDEYAVCVRVNDFCHSVRKEEVEKFFNEQVLPLVDKE